MWATQLSPGCVDQDAWLPDFTNEMYGVTGSSDIQTCADAIPYCGAELAAVRLYCPVACGCNSPASGQWRIWDAEGCPHTQCRISENYQQVLAQMPCRDWTPTEFKNSDAWSKLSDSFLTWMTSKGRYDVQFVSEFRDAVTSQGCAKVAQAIATSPVTIRSQMMPFCPVALGCTNPQLWDAYPAAEWWCPKACKDTTPAIDR
eukprot:gnl/TRDRNA2_/TRDRNA2_176037_c1_seq3.p1 gnl/TRDRNA2_/TRDRNA2_176037_c1~~gnl/TRDRNA2_/TRDRNA2_176037_c1_seq3.p1  ORF type:complete len:216 (-),score=10.91 gnl/TRDRNA2_/TRDRNA2_176037_c1_seq3:174-779(-)